MRPEDSPLPQGADPAFLERLGALNAAFERLIASVTASHARSEGLELILAVLLARLTADHADGLAAADCAEALREMGVSGVPCAGAPFPDPMLLDDVVKILGAAPPKGWRPRVVVGGKASAPSAPER